MITCPNCGGAAIINQRVDSDWHNSPCSSVNDKTYYTPEDWRRIDDGLMKIDVSVYHCLKCKHTF